MDITEAHAQVDGGLRELVTRFEAEQAEAEALAPSAGMRWTAVGKMVINERHQLVARAETEAAAAIIARNAPGNIIDATSSKQRISAWFLRNLGEGRIADVQTNAHVAAELIAEYRGEAAGFGFLAAAAHLH
ncbi:hypothetical protein [Leifsonia sp. Leaf264]|uniref:hypothetical protein n=1 Tax=Leifsonia sp. Leaf264 TaxID=1736314 RepID=UPI0006FD6547|nr:hypothetical protein [Leifsonia sp. Leaf264]KQO98882.1 hypothetical protein ASF30_12530 [Leifsonia sp. Leaf264]